MIFAGEQATLELKILHLTYKHRKISCNSTHKNSCNVLISVPMPLMRIAA